MGLKERTLDIDLGGGLMEGIDERLVEPPHTPVIDNAIFNKVGRWEPRHGYTAIPTTGLPAAIPQANALHVRGTTQLFHQTPEGTFAFNEDQNAYQNAPGDAPDLPYSAEVWRRSIFRAYGVNVADVDIAVTGNYTCYVWSGADPADPVGTGSPVSVYALVTSSPGIGQPEEVVSGPTVIWTASYGRVRCEAIGDIFVASFTNTNGTFRLRDILAMAFDTMNVAAGWPGIAGFSELVGAGVSYGKHELLADPDSIHVHLSFPRDGDVGAGGIGVPRGLGLRKFLVADILAAPGGPVPIITEYSNLNTVADGGQAMHIFLQDAVWRLLLVAIGYDPALGDPHTLYRVLMDLQTYGNTVASAEVAADPNGGQFRNVTIVRNSNDDAWIVWDATGNAAFPNPTDPGAVALPPVGVAGNMSSVNWRLFDYATEALDADTLRRYNLALASHGFTFRRAGVWGLPCFLVSFDYAGDSTMMDGTDLDGTLQPACFIVFPYRALFPTDLEAAPAGPDISRLGVIARVGQDTGAQAPRLTVNSAGPPATTIYAPLPHARNIGPASDFAWRTALTVYMTEDTTNLPLLPDVPPQGSGSSGSPSAWVGASAVARRTRFYVPLPERGPVLGVAAFEFTNLGVESQGNARQDANVYIGGGTVWQHDGTRGTENTPHVAPEAPYIQVQAGVGSHFWVRTMIVQTDAQGVLHRGPPSPPMQSGETAVAPFTVTTLRPPLSAWDMVGADTWAIEVYRTTSSVPPAGIAAGTQGGPYYLAGRTIFTGSDASSGIGGMVSALYNIANEDLVTRPSLYVEGGRFAAEPPPACRLLTAADNRLWIRGDEDRGILHYSALLEEGIAPEFNGALQVRIGDGTREITAAVPMDESLAVFTTDEIWTVVGDGPNNMGGGSDYVTRRVASDVGCVDPRSVALTRHGVVFKSRRGIELLTRGFGIKTPFLGKACEDSITPTSVVTSAVVVPDRNEVRFSVQGASYLVVWNYEHDKWSRWTNHAGIVDAALWGETYVYLHSNGKCRRENTGYADLNMTTDAVEAIVQQATLPWFKLGAKQGFQRIWKVSVLGLWRSAHSATIEVQYNYDSDSAWEVSPAYDWSTDRLPAGAGGYPPQGADRYQFRYAPIRQQHQSVRFRITVTPSTSPGPPGAGAFLSTLALNFGLYGGMMRLEPIADH